MTAILTGVRENLNAILLCVSLMVSKLEHFFHVYCPFICLLLRTVFSSFPLSVLFDFFSSLQLLICCRYQSIFCLLAMFSSCSVNHLMSWLAVSTTQERFNYMRCLLSMVGLISWAVEILFRKPVSTCTFNFLSPFWLHHFLKKVVSEHLHVGVTRAIASFCNLGVQCCT